MLTPLADAHGLRLGEPRFDDDHYDAKIDVVVDMRPAVVSFAFGCPTSGTVDALRAAGIEVWVTVTDASEAVLAADAGADAVVAQGSEGGGHRGSFVDDDGLPESRTELLGHITTAVSARPHTPAVVGSGGITHGADIAETLASSAVAAQLGTAFLLGRESGTNTAQRRAVAEDRPTMLTRAFTGRYARGIVNAWADDFSAVAPSAYPEIHHHTAPLRAHGRASGNDDLVNLWAGIRHVLARRCPQGEIVAQLVAELATERRRSRAPG